MDTTRLRQVEGGTVIKQADRASTMTFILQDSLGREVDLNGQQAQIALYTLDGRYWETHAIVDKARVSFNLPGNLSEDDYILDISVAGYVFPSDRDFIIRVVKGYKDLPSKERAESIKLTSKELIQKTLKEEIEKINPEKFRGLPGKQGTQGIQGIRGERGLTGERGLKGEKGEKGEAGLSLKVVGFSYDQDGNTLVKVNSGENFTVKKGEKGEKGNQGVKGEQGERGPKGDKGEPGKDGADGVVVFESLTQAQKESLRGERGLQGLPGEKPLVFSSKPPAKKDVLWVKSDNLRSLYQDQYLDPSSEIFIGNIKNTNVGREFEDGMNLLIVQQYPIINIKKITHFRIGGETIEVIKSFELDSADKYKCFKVSDDGIRTILKYANLQDGTYENSGYDYFFPNVLGISKYKFEALEKIGEETYSTLSIYNSITQRWEKLSEDGKNGIKGEKGDPLRFEDLSKEQKKELRGEKGEPGKQGEPGRDGKDGHTLTVQAYFSGTLRNHYTKTVRAHCDVFYDGTKIRVEDTDAEYTYFVDGEHTKPIKDRPVSNDFFSDTPRPNCEFIEIVYTVSYKGLKARSVARLVNVNDGANGSPGKGIVDIKTGREIKIWSGSKSDYDAIKTKDGDTLYLIKE